MNISNGLVEQHIHGAFGIDFMNCEVDDVNYFASEIIKYGVCAFFPTVMTDSVDIIKERINVIKKAQKKQAKNEAKIIGIHLEGPFINPLKSGIHDKKFILPLDVKYLEKIYDDIIKIITIAPELDYNGTFINYLLSKDIKISAGHTTASDLSKVNQVTHLYNAMGCFSHRENSTVVSSLINDEIFTELIADLKHVNKDVLKITFKQKSPDKILLISDALPLSHCDKTQMSFASQLIYNQNGNLVNKDGVFAGSSMLLSDIIRNLVKAGLLSFENAIKCASSNQLKYHNIESNINIVWNDDLTIDKIIYK